LPAGLPRVPQRNLPAGYGSSGVLATPGAIELPPARGAGTASIAYLKFARGDRDAIERARNAVAAIVPSGSVNTLNSTTELPALRTVRRGIYIGAVLILLLIGGSLLIGGLEQLRERRPVLAAIAAFGTPRRVMARSVLWQAAIPVTLGVAVAAVIGVGLGALLITVGGRPVEIDWGAVAAMAGAGAAVILLVTALTLPALIRISRPAGLRAE
jgi:predicted lysophospholipase L1 biosynthesis ABC-type transport system permease subunit